MLCKTCRDYPRHIEEFEGVREISLSLSCLEAARLILSCPEPVHFLTRETEKEETYPEFDFFLYTKLTDARDVMIRLLQDRRLDIRLRISMVLALAHDMQSRIGGGRLFEIDGLLTRYEKQGAAKRFAQKLKPFCIEEKGTIFSDAGTVFDVSGNGSPERRISIVYPKPERYPVWRRNGLLSGTETLV